MTYLEARKRRSSGKRIAFYACAAIVAIVAAVQLLRPMLFPSLFTTIARPFWRVQLAIQLGSMRSPEALMQENAYLTQQLDAANVRLQSVQSLESQNEELKALLGRASSTPYTLAAVLEHPAVSAYDELIIDIGSDYGLQDGDPVYASGDALIGKVSEVLGDTAKVLLYSSPGQSYEVMIGKAHSSAEAIGRGGGQYEAQLPRDVSVSAGDPVNAPGLSAAPFGIVSAVVSDPAQPFEKVLFAPPVNIYQLRWVLVDTHQQI
ncbi:MAG: rod shape-determining protein MreC [Patescibacteria group bacterium]|nr:rod shape-determining protein MreC [Patescibacteria group bacterium]MDE1941099.1 rod shape-determining protein MreC [Patescibacteria group bacterium]MDE1966830.1 rod shape-determining protein MreC [Patescibacteria group bacterium]